MKKLACTAVFCAAVGTGLMLLATPLEARGGRGGPGGRPGFHAARFHGGPFHGRHWAHHHHHHHRFYYAGGWWWGAPYGDAYDDYPYYADVPPPAPPHIAEPIIRTVENSKDVCRSQPVTVPATGGGKTTVNVIRC